MKDDICYVTDTHSLIWYFTEDERLSKRALDAFEETIKEGIIIIPAVVLAEVMFVSKKRSPIVSFDLLLEKIGECENFVVAPLDLNIIKIANRIEKDLEMHDKLIVATTLYYNVPLITRDEIIRKINIVQTIW
jgi:PIN domain nuclease of toxin-antitoxin system